MHSGTQCNASTDMHSVLLRTAVCSGEAIVINQLIPAGTITLSKTPASTSTVTFA